MALPESLAEALNDQITNELGASLSYLQMAAGLEADNRPGMAHWMRVQSDEEAEHARMFMEFVLSRDGRVTIGSLPAPRSDFAHPAEAFAAALEQEKTVSGQIRRLYQLAQETGDVDSLPFLQGFLTEQIEEESSVGAIHERLSRVADSEVGLALLDNELASRSSD